LLAVKIARRVDGPVKVVWSREEDIRHGMYRPYYYDRMSAGLDANGHPIAWTHRIAGSSVVARYVPSAFKDGLEFDVIDCAAKTPYAFRTCGSSTCGSNRQGFRRRSGVVSA